MNEKKKSKSAPPKPARVSKTKKPEGSGEKLATKAKTAGAKSKTAVVKSSKTKTETVAATAPKRVAKKKEPGGKSKEPVTKKKTRKAKAEDAAGAGAPIVDPLGDVSSGEARTYLGDAELLAHGETKELHAGEAVGAETASEARGGEPAGSGNAGEAFAEKEATDAAGEPHPPAKLERLQKILSQAGIASRRHAEEMIVAGRVVVNGQVVTQLGSKADPARDHIRVDGKLLQGAERHRYIMLNKPKGYVTTVSDPEGRPTVMDFVAKARERLYPVGRLDYLSEGLLLMTNDGELANLLTKAGSGVEKTYLVKVAGQPSEEELERLRGGVAIERDEPGSARVRTAPARIRPVREGDNPWFEVVLIEGRNRELRKMFSAVGHFVEKIRRVGYGPLVLDVEPGNLRELTPDEVRLLRLTAEGKMKPKRVKVDRILPVKTGRPAERRPEKEWRAPSKPFPPRDERPGKTEWSPRGPEFRGRQGGEGRKSEFRGGEFQGGAKGGFDKRRGQQAGARPERFGAKPGFDRPRTGRSFPTAKPNFARPAGKPPRFGDQSGPKSGAERTFRSERPAFEARPRFDRPAFPGHPPRERTERGFPEKRRFPAKPPFDAAKPRPFRAPGERPSFQRADAPKRQFEKRPEKSFGARSGKAWTERPRTGPPAAGKDALKGRIESRGGAKGGGFSKRGSFSKTRSKGPGFRGKFSGGKSRGFRPPGSKPGGGIRRG